MEALVVLLLIALLIVVITGNNRLQSRLQHLEEDSILLRRQLQQFVSGIKDTPKNESPLPEEQPAPVTPGLHRRAPKVEEPEPELKKASPTPALPVAPEAVEPEIPVPAPLPQPVITPPVSSVPPAPPPPPLPGFFERNPDLEKFIGENLISKIGIAILVIGIGFFVKYAIDQDWIKPAGRVAIGMLCGGILVGLAHRLQRTYKAFSSVLVGGGLAVFYFTIALAYKDYSLFSQTTAFIIMVVITIFAILLSLLYDRQEVAIIALAGGFALPFMVSDGSGNYVTLFSYLLLLNAGLLVIAYRKGWRLLNGIAFGATALLFWGWLGTLPGTTPRQTYLGGFAFATAFYGLFLAINLAHNIRERRRFIASDFGILLADNCLYFSAGIYLLYAADAAQFKGLFSAALGLLNFVLATVLIRRKSIDKTVLYLLVGITLSFVSLTAPLQLQGHFITLFWAAESVVLLWLFQQSRIRILQWGLLAVWVCSIVSLLLDWMAVYGMAGQLPVLTNRGFMTTLFAAAANTALYQLMRRDVEEVPFTMFERQTVARFFGGIAIVLLFMTGALEIGYQFSQRYPGTGLSGMYLQLYFISFVLALRVLWQRSIIKLSWPVMMALSGACLLMYLVTAPYNYSLQSMMLLSGLNPPHFIAHWITAALSILVFYQLVQALRNHVSAADYGVLIAWIGAAFAVIFISIEMSMIVKAIAYRGPQSLGETARNYVRIGLPVIWGLCSFALMWLGMKHKYRPLRITSLTLFSITLLKLFLFDIRDVGPGGKIAAFCSLGVLLLVVSFMYQRLKQLIIEDERKQDAA